MKSFVSKFVGLWGIASYLLIVVMEGNGLVIETLLLEKKWEREKNEKKKRKKLEPARTRTSPKETRVSFPPILVLLINKYKYFFIFPLSFFLLSSFWKRKKALPASEGPLFI